MENTPIKRHVTDCGKWSVLLLNDGTFYTVEVTRWPSGRTLRRHELIRSQFNAEVIFAAEKETVDLVEASR